MGLKRPESHVYRWSELGPWDGTVDLGRLTEGELRTMLEGLAWTLGSTEVWERETWLHTARYVQGILMRNPDRLQTDRATLELLRRVDFLFAQMGGTRFPPGCADAAGIWRAAFMIVKAQDKSKTRR